MWKFPNYMLACISSHCAIRSVTRGSKDRVLFCIEQLKVCSRHALFAGFQLCFIWNKHADIIVAIFNNIEYFFSKLDILNFCITGSVSPSVKKYG